MTSRIKVTICTPVFRNSSEVNLTANPSDLGCNSLALKQNFSSTEDLKEYFDFRLDNYTILSVELGAIHKRSHQFLAILDPSPLISTHIDF